MAERLLRNVNRNAAPRQQTLRAMLDWSYALLDPTEQAVLCRLSVFAGAFTVELAQQVATDADVDEWAVLDAVSALVDKSLLQLVRERPPRFRLLETTRLYATEQLSDAGEAEDVQRRHGQVLAALADTAVHAFSESTDAEWLAAYSGDYDEWALAFQRACARRDPDVAGATGRALCRLDRLRNVDAMDRSRMAAAHALLPLAGPAHGRCCGNRWRGRSSCNSPMYRESRPCRRRPSLARSRRSPPTVPRVVDDGPGVLRLRTIGPPSTTAVAAARALEDPAWPPRERLWPATAATVVWALARRPDRLPRACAGRVDARAAGRAMNEVVWARLNLADYALWAGDAREAISSYEAALAEVRALKWPNMVGYCLSR